MTKRLLSGGLRAGLLAGALLLGACGPSIDPAAKADIDGRVAALQAGGGVLPAPATFEPMPLAAGQWAQYKMVDDKGQPSFLTYKVLGEEGGAYWIETLNESYYGRTAQKMLLAFGNRFDPSQIEVRGVITLDRRGNVNPMPPAMLPLLQSTFKSALATLAISWQGLPQESATVPAGRFDGCYHARTEAQWGPWRSLADSWRHPAVPLSGLVRSQGVDRPFTMDLVAFGATGATPDF
ncbi:MAG TPA: hypothetical protein VHO06_11560 [Polyangia bacterium]|nr:hypothetical protein [Polyangia bacterium]